MGPFLSNCSAPAALGYTQPCKLPTPPKGRQAGQQLPGVVVPPLKLGSAGLTGPTAASTSAPPAAAAAAPVADENTVANALAAAAPGQADKSAAGGAKAAAAAANKKGALRFLPGKKVGWWNNCGNQQMAGARREALGCSTLLHA